MAKIKSGIDQSVLAGYCWDDKSSIDRFTAGTSIFSSLPYRVQNDLQPNLT
jgi:hypothetical protein